MPVILDGAARYESIDLQPEEFFQALAGGYTVSTSQPAPWDVIALWEQVLLESDELVYIPMSSGLSSACSTAMGLANEYAGRVFVVDNHRISESPKSSVLDALALREAGCGAREIQRELEASAYDSIAYAGVETMEHLRRGGRITARAAAISTVLQIKPLLKIEGAKLDVCAKVRGTIGCKKKLLETARQVAEHYVETRDVDTGITSSYRDTSAAEDWQKMAAAAFPEYRKTCGPLTFSISTHVGPDTFGLTVSHRLARTKGEQI